MSQKFVQQIENDFFFSDVAVPFMLLDFQSGDAGYLHLNWGEWHLRCYCDWLCITSGGELMRKTQAPSFEEVHSFLTNDKLDSLSIKAPDLSLHLGMFNRSLWLLPRQDDPSTLWSLSYPKLNWRAQKEQGLRCQPLT